MTLTEFKRICEARTKGEWFSVDGPGGIKWVTQGKYHPVTSAYHTIVCRAFCGDENFIAACSVMVDPLMRVVEAAKEMLSAMDFLGSAVPREAMEQALAALEVPDA